MRGQLRVGRCTYDRNGKRTDPFYEGFTPIVCLTASSPYGELGPYLLKDEYGRIMENYWQACKVYPNVPKSIQRYSRYDHRIIWNHPEETHAVKQEDGSWELQPAYFAWRQKLQFNKDPVRYPVGFDKNARGSCLFALKDFIKPETNEIILENKPLNYIEARKAIYLALYVRLVQKQEKFKELKNRLNKGENLLIIEVDAPHGEDLAYYREKYGVEEDFIVNNTMIASKENLEIVSNDPKHPMGHGYALCWALLDLPVE